MNSDNLLMNYIGNGIFVSKIDKETGGFYDEDLHCDKNFLDR